MKLSDFKDEKHSLAKRFIQAVNKALGKKDKIIISEVLKAKRLSGVSAKPLSCALENGQNITAYVCVSNENDVPKLELFRVDINGKQLPMTNRFSDDTAIFNKAASEVAVAVIGEQAKFDKKRSKDGMAVVKEAQKRSDRQRKDKIQTAKTELDALNQQIAQDEGVRDELQAQLDELKKS